MNSYSTLQTCKYFGSNKDPAVLTAGPRLPELKGFRSDPLASSYTTIALVDRSHGQRYEDTGRHADTPVFMYSCRWQEAAGAAGSLIQDSG